MPKIVTETMIALRLVWFRVLLYFLIPFLTIVLSQTESWSGETWENTHWFIKIRVLIIAFLGGMGAFVAFIDQSLQKAKDEIKELDK